MHQSNDIYKTPLNEYAPDIPFWAKERPDLYGKSSKQAWQFERAHRRQKWFASNNDAYMRGEKTDLKPSWAMTFDEFCADDMPDIYMLESYVDAIKKQYKL